jgi:hypothetical protein
MRRRARIDANHGEIVKILRLAGATVHSMAEVGEGCPDLLVGYRGRTVLVEVKDPSKPPSARKLTPAQEDWHKTWNGSPVRIVTNLVDAMAALGDPQAIMVSKTMSNGID